MGYDQVQSVDSNICSFVFFVGGNIFVFFWGVETVLHVRTASMDAILTRTRTASMDAVLGRCPVAMDADLNGNNNKPSIT